MELDLAEGQQRASFRGLALKLNRPGAVPDGKDLMALITMLSISIAMDLGQGKERLER